MNSDSISFQPPRGMRDFHPRDMALRNVIFDAWRTASRRFGFVQYDACVVESLELLKRKAGEEIVDQIYSFKDKSGRDLALRPEMTPTLARMVAAQQGALTFPLKWFAIAQCFRYERPTRGRKREHYQWNLDAIGERSPIAEVEVLATALEALVCMDVERSDVVVDFSSRALLSDILCDTGIERTHHARAFVALDKRGKVPDEDIKAQLSEDGLADSAVDGIFAVLGIGRLSDAEGALSAKRESHANVLRFLEIADCYGLTETLNFNIAVVRGLAYYTGIVFEAFDVQRELRAIFGGGRYDNLLSDIGGDPATAVGLGFGDVVVAELLNSKHADRAPIRSGGVAVGYLESVQQPAAIGVATALRRAGKDVDLALGPEKAKKFFSRCGKAGFDEATYIGPDDVAAGTVRIKNLETREERVVGIEHPTSNIQHPTSK